jgi:type I restriction enzyme S subunit
MSFPRYKAYKDSGVEWLGDLPKHWGFAPLKRMFAVVGGSTPRSDDQSLWGGPIPWVTPADLSSTEEIYITETARSISEAGLASCGTSVVPRGSIILSTRAPIGSIAIASMSLCTNQGCKSLVPVEASSNLFFYFLLYSAVRELNMRGKGTTFLELSADELASFRVPVPSAAEQSAIAAFLERETAKIDALVEEQQRLIALLEEKRQAVISHAVTKGLDPHAPMKDSGVEWLGEVPTNWAVGSLNRVADRVVVGIAEAAAHAYAQSGIPILRSTNVRAGQIVGELLFIAPEFAADRGSKLIAAGDLLTVRTGHAGVTTVVPEELDGCQCFTMLITTLSEGHDPHFYCYWLNSAGAVHYFSIEAWGSAQPNISVPILKATPVPIPPKDVQVSIVQFLDQAVAKLDALISEAGSAIALLQERRSALISAAVTGKIDVRGLAPQSAEAA